MNATIKRMAAAAVLVVAVVAPVAGRAASDPCQNPYVKMLQPSGGQLIVNGTTVSTPGGQSLTLSTTGTIQVKLEHGCAFEVDLKVTKTGPGAPSVIHTNHWGPLGCDVGTKTDTVAIGLDGGTYQFDVSGMACTGRKLRSDGHGGTVVDPPLPTVL